MNKELKWSSSYVYDLMNPTSLRKYINFTVRTINKISKTKLIDALVFSGISGAAVGFAVAAKLKIPVFYIRVFGEHSHSNITIEKPKSIMLNSGKHFKYLIIDDFIESGATADRIIKMISEEFNFKKIQSKCLGIVLYKARSTDAHLYKYNDIKIYHPKYEY